LLKKAHPRDTAAGKLAGLQAGRLACQPASVLACQHVEISMDTVSIECVAWVTQFVGGDGTRRVVLQEPIAPGVTVRDVLRRLSSRFPRLAETLWDAAGDALAEHIEILVNDAVLGVGHELESRLQAGDRITLVGAYTGGRPD
jgi:molybdopterin converting factor small subunit